MAESLHNCSVAYTKGTTSNGKTCPYGATKRQLKHWWLAGCEDARLNQIDHNFIIVKEPK